MTTPASDIADWLRLDCTPGVGPAMARALLARFGVPENIFSAGYQALLEVVPPRIADALVTPPSDKVRALIERTMAWAADEGNLFLTLADERYPARLLLISDPPSILYVKGRPELLSKPALAVVGSRNATAQGKSNAEKFAEALGGCGLTIVSGMALGIDAAAHEGGLRAAGSTVAVIGTGADVVYPARNRDLAHRIAAGGCIVSEYPLGTSAIASNFPRRNRIVSGLACGVLVVEAAAQSGSLITARMAADQGRDVFAIPGSIHSPLSKGCHLLIRQGAKLVESAQDILEELGETLSMRAQSASQVDNPDNHDENAILMAMGFDPADVDILAHRCGFSAAAVQAELLALELAGRVEMLAGGSYRRMA